MKKCSNCGKEFKPSFRHSHQKFCSNKCWKEKNKKDIKEYTEKYHQKHKKKRNEYSKEYNKKLKEKIQKYNKKWRKENLEKVKKTNKKSARKYRKNNPYKIKVRDKANRKIKIPKGQLCEVCKINKATEKHHPNYNQPLNVIFVCRDCHRGLI